MHVRLGILFKDMTMYDINNLILPRQILYKESNNHVIVFVLASVPCCLFPATIVVQDIFEEFIRFIPARIFWPGNYLHLSNFENT